MDFWFFNTYFLPLFVTVAAGGVGVMGKDWLGREGRGGDKLLIFLICSSIFLVNFSFYARNFDRIFSSLLVALHSSKFGKTW
jgi:hypothetical protein